MNIGPYNNRPDMGRLREIIRVMTKYHFGNILEAVGLKNRLFETLKLYIKSPEEVHEPAHVRLRLVLEELGTTFIKLGQVLSTRADLVGREVAEELAKLQDEAPPFPFEDVKRVLESELGVPMEEVFSEFQEEPVASASIGQVHRARLRNGDAVAVKVQRPGIADTVKSDIILMKYLAKLANDRVPGLRYYNLPGIVAEFERAIRKELDYHQEANNVERFRAMFMDDETVYAPYVYREYSTGRVLTMQYVDGVKLTDILKSDIKFNARVIAERGARCYFKQIFIHGFFHADPHPGNILVQKGNVLCFLDFGMMGHLDRSFRDRLAELFILLMNYDVNGIVNQLRYMNILTEETDLEEVKYDIIDLLDRYYGADVRKVGEILTEFTMPGMIRRHRIRIPRDFVLLARVMSMAEDLGERLDPRFNGLEVAWKMTHKLIRNRLNPLRNLDEVPAAIIELEHIMNDLPRGLISALQKLEEGKLKMELEHRNLDEISVRIERSTNRISLAMLVSALIIGSSLVTIPREALILEKFPFLGIFGFAVSFLIALALIVSIIKSRRLS
ncbi:ubiquinone biosynthesis protein [Methanothermobacter defluvii]|jgi:ubiquinone biosynthesis protein|uniref:Ubiquinone biosynthesis protein n=1 Tax=Methanothermobacter defluvii TaxID=49339 RepID=A0A371NB81_9EURY|nr:AarF/ABC1/UbiB kinase family protein [Methanothermobacter defluvii]REE26301.1 ubiquinone biosynthesis protein [Methanothermobacter defluvii]